MPTRLCLLLSALLVAAGCQTAQQSTRLTHDDREYVVANTLEQLKSGNFFKGRTADSPPCRVTVDKVYNLTSDLIPEGEQWQFVLRVWQDPDVQTLARSKNIHTQVRPETLERLQLQGIDTSLTHYETPTHLLTATFDSATRTHASGKGPADSRVETYVMIYRIVEVATGQEVWTGNVEFKRAATGNLID